MGSGAGRDATPPHILVVDDDRRLRELLHKYLVENGFMVTTVEDAAAARARLKGLTFDLIVLDVMMPGESGLELTQSLRADNDVPILLLTAMGEAADRVAGFESGADDYLAKPFEPRELLLRIASILRRAGPPPQAPTAVRFGDFVFDPAQAELRRGDELVRLTSGETALMGVTSEEALHSWHATHARRHAAWRHCRHSGHSSAFFLSVRHETVRRQHHARDTDGVLERRAGDLERVNDAALLHVAEHVVARVIALALLKALYLLDDDRTVFARVFGDPAHGLF